MEAKFTKGEWRQSHREKADGMYSTEVYDEDGMTICTVAWHQVPIKGGYATDREANAKLLKSAPEMYEALKRSINILENTLEIVRYVWPNLYLEIKEQITQSNEVLKKATE